MQEDHDDRGLDQFTLFFGGELEFTPVCLEQSEDSERENILVKVQKILIISALGHKLDHFNVLLDVFLCHLGPTAFDVSQPGFGPLHLLFLFLLECLIDIVLGYFSDTFRMKTVYQVRIEHVTVGLVHEKVYDFDFLLLYFKFLHLRSLCRKASHMANTRFGNYLHMLLDRLPTIRLFHVKGILRLVGLL